MSRQLPSEVVSARSKSGRHWAVRYLQLIDGAYSDDRVRLDPIGYDVCPARSPKTGRWQGGVRSIVVKMDDVVDPSKWRPVGDD